jgi:hypothetical protein
MYHKLILKTLQISENYAINQLASKEPINPDPVSCGLMHQNLFGIAP